MTRTLASILLLLAAAPALAKPPVWDKRIDTPKRFKVLKEFDSAAVLDQETGLVWAITPLAGQAAWIEAGYECNSASIGDRGGWRLPSLAEFSSIVAPDSHLLPAGNPFLVPEDAYWTATASSDTSAYLGNITTGLALIQAAKSQQLSIWCVRGGIGADGNIP